MAEEHRKMVEGFIGRALTRYETVHHINGWHHDNRLENFYVFPSSRTHNRWHAVLRDGTVEPDVLESNLEALKHNGMPFAEEGVIRSQVAKRREVRNELEQELEDAGLLDKLDANERYLFISAKLKEKLGEAILWKKDIFKPT